MPAACTRKALAYTGAGRLHSTSVSPNGTHFRAHACAIAASRPIPPSASGHRSSHVCAGVPSGSREAPGGGAGAMGTGSGSRPTNRTSTLTADRFSPHSTSHHGSSSSWVCAQPPGPRGATCPLTTQAAEPQPLPAGDAFELISQGWPAARFTSWVCASTWRAAHTRSRAPEAGAAAVSTALRPAPPPAGSSAVQDPGSQDGRCIDSGRPGSKNWAQKAQRCPSVCARAGGLCALPRRAPSRCRMRSTRPIGTARTSASGRHCASQSAQRTVRAAGAGRGRPAPVADCTRWRGRVPCRARELAWPDPLLRRREGGAADRGRPPARRSEAPRAPPAPRSLTDDRPPAHRCPPCWLPVRTPPPSGVTGVRLDSAAPTAAAHCTSRDAGARSPAGEGCAASAACPDGIGSGSGAGGVSPPPSAAGPSHGSTGGCSTSCPGPRTGHGAAGARGAAMGPGAWPCPRRSDRRTTAAR